MKVSVAQYGRFEVYRGVMKLSLLSAFTSCLTGFVNLLCLCNAAVYLLDVESYTITRIVIVCLQAVALIVSVKSRKGFKESLVRFFHVCVYKDEYESIIKSITDAPIATIGEYNSCCILGKDQKYFLVYMLSDTEYRCFVFESDDETYRMKIEIDLNKDYTPYELYNPAIQATLTCNKLYDSNFAFPIETELYENYINTTIRKRAIDDILEDLS